MSGSPVYIGNKLLGSLSYRIGQFSKEPIAGITPIAQMLEVRDLTIPQGTGIRDQGTEVQGAGSREKGVEGAGPGSEGAGSDTLFQAMETPLVMTGFSPEAVRLWQEKMAGTGLEMVAAGGEGGGSEASDAISKAAIASVEPGSAVSAQLVRGDVEIAATCTVTYVDPKQLLACGHPILQAGPVSLPMTTAEVVATLASPLNAFKIINTEQAIGAFTEDRDAAIRGVFGAKPHMIPVHINMPGVAGRKKLNVEVLDMPGLTPQAVMVVVYQSLLQTNESTADISYHITGTIDVEGYAASPVDVWAADGAQPQLAAALLLGEKFNKLFSNEGRQSAIREVDLNVEAMPRRLSVELESARFVSGNIVHAGDRVMVEATVRAVAGAGAKRAHPVHGSGAAGRGDAAGAGERRGDAGPDAGSAADDAAAAGHGDGAGAGGKPACGRPHLREPAVAGDTGGNGGAHPDRPAHHHGQCAGSRCAPATA